MRSVRLLPRLVNGYRFVSASFQVWDIVAVQTVLDESKRTRWDRPLARPLKQRRRPARIVTADRNHPEAPTMIRERRALPLATLFLAAGVIVLPGRAAGADEPPALSVEAVYPGATAADVEQTIAAPIEEQVNGVEHLRQLRSRCGGDGSYSLEVSFAAGTDLNIAQILV